jgi:type VI protein secretion system component Hcp
MDDKLRLAISIDKTFIVIVEIHLKTVLRKTYHVSISYRSITWKISDFTYLYPLTVFLRYMV